MSVPTTSRFLRGTLALFALLAFASPGYADRTPLQARTHMLDTAKRENIPSYQRKLANGTQRVYLNPQAQHLGAMEQALPKGSDVVEIMHIGTPDAYHTMAIFDRQLLHSQYSPAGNWRLRQWSDRLRPGGRKLWSAMIQLSPQEAANMRQHIAAAFAEEGPEHAAGPNWANGHLKQGGALGVNGINCVATWCDMPIGDHGERLHQLVGLPSYSGSPRAFQLALEQTANERVFGIANYGPPDPTFLEHQDQDKTFK
ncbi:MAG: hypothetical protein ABI321_06030 [Polyangia bacterium]